MAFVAGGHAYLAGSVIILLCACSAAAAGAPAGQGDSAMDAALHYFTRYEATAFIERFDALRPVPVGPAEREGVIATLPAHGDIPSLSLDSIQRDKLAAVRRILALHQRETVYVVKVVEVPRAAVGLHARTIVLVSKPALDLLRAEELQALIAHEIGHEYLWNDYARARRDDDRARLRMLELLCDGMAIVTLRRAGLDSRRLDTALDKMIRYNQDRFGTALNEDHYPPLAGRRAFARRLTAWLDSGR